MQKKHRKALTMRALVVALATSSCVISGMAPAGHANSYDQLKWGFIDHTGKMQISLKLEDSPVGFTDGLCDVGIEQGRFIIDHNGKKIFHLSKNAWPVNLGGGTAIVPFGKKSCMLDNRGKRIFTAQISSVHGYSEGFWYLSLANGRRIFVDIHGRELLLPKYFQAAGNFSEGLAPVRNDRKEGYIDASGKLVIPPQFDHVDNFSGGMAPVVIEGELRAQPGRPPRWEGRKGFIDKTGKILFEHDYSFVGKYNSGLARVWSKILPKPGSNQSSHSSKCLGFIDMTGTLVIKIDPEGKSGPAHIENDFSQDLCIASDGKLFGYIDKSGKFVIKPQYRRAMDFSEGLAPVWLEHNWALIDSAGKIVVPPIYSEVDSSLFSEGLLAVKLKEHWGFIDASGRMVIQPTFPRANRFCSGLAAVAVGTDRFKLERVASIPFGAPPVRLLGKIGKTSYACRSLSEAIEDADHLYDLEQNLSGGATSNLESINISFLIPYFADSIECSGNLLCASVFSPSARPDLIAEAHKICDYELCLLEATTQLSNHDAWNVLNALAHQYKLLGDDSTAESLYQRAAKVNQNDFKWRWIGANPGAFPTLNYFIEHGAAISKLRAIEDSLEKPDSPKNNLSDTYDVYVQGFDRTQQFLIKRGELKSKGKN